MRFKSMTVGKQRGELARLRVLGGPDNGVVFVITAPRVVIGRAEDNDIMLTDTKSSRKHAELVWQAGQFLLRDLGSSHGFLVNGDAQKQAALKSGDKIGVGATVLEFVASRVEGATQMLVRPPTQTVRTVGTGNSGLTQFITRPPQAAQQGAASGRGAAAGALGVASSRSGAPQGFIEKNKKMILLLGGLMAVAGLMPEAEQRIQGKNTKRQNYYTKIDPSEAARNPALASVDFESPQFKDADKHFHLGMRELRVKNYLRAMASFETAIQIYPVHPLAAVYLKTSKEQMKKDAQTYINDAKRDEEASRFKEALNHYGAVKRLYTNDQSHEMYKQADTRSKDLEKKIRDMERN